MPKLDAALLEVLGEPLPELEQLSTANQKKLAADMAAAHQAHDAFLKESMDNALEHIPRLLRGTVKKFWGFERWIETLNCAALRKRCTSLWAIWLTSTNWTP